MRATAVTAGGPQGPSGDPQLTPRFWPLNASLLIPVSTPHQATSVAFAVKFPSRQDPSIARAAYQAKRDEWRTLDLRQEWADEAFMRGHLKAAGIRIADSLEPATVARLRLLLRRAGVCAKEAREAVLADSAKSLSGWLEMNPKLPLWAAVALVLEATGRFTVLDADEATL